MFASEFMKLKQNILSHNATSQAVMCCCSSTKNRGNTSMWYMLR